MAEGLRLLSGLTCLRSRLSRRPMTRADDTPVSPSEASEAPWPSEPAVAWIINQSELGEMAAVAIEMLDLAGRRRRRGS